MAAVGTNTVTSIARRHIVPEIVDQIYTSNPLFFRLNQARRIMRGGYQLEVPLMYAEMAAGGYYSGFDTLDVTPSDTVKNGVWDWKQAYVPVTIDGLTLIKTDQPEAIANIISLQFAQSEMQMAEILGTGVWSDGTTNTQSIDGLKGAVDDGGVLPTYAGIVRASNTWWNANDDSSTATLTSVALNSMFTSCSEGGRHPTLIISRQDQYNRFWKICQDDQSSWAATGAVDEQLAQAGFTNILFNGVPWVVDSHCADGPSTSNSGIYMLNEDYIFLYTSPRADFYLEDFQTPVNQDAMTSKLLWAGNLVVTNCATQGKLSNIAA